jgi:hypothetical protein
MKLESLKNGKFEKNILSKSAMMMLDGGAIFGSNPQGDGTFGDTANYHCSGPNGELYDRTVTYQDGTVEYESSGDMFPGSDDSYYV